MLADLFKSSKDKITQPLKTPFLGTYLLVWIIRKWELVYPLFNFDDSHNLQYKKWHIKSFFQDGTEGFIKEILCNTLWTFGLLVFTYILLTVSRAITILFEKRIRPWVSGLLDKSSVVDKAAHEAVRNERDDIAREYEKERDEKAKLVAEKQVFEKQITELEDEERKLKLTLKDSQLAKKSLKEKLEEIRQNNTQIRGEASHLKSQLMKLKEVREKLKSAPEFTFEDNPGYAALADWIREFDFRDAFIDTALDITSGLYRDDLKEHRERFKEKGLIIEIDEGGESYDLTNLGVMVLRELTK